MKIEITENGKRYLEDLKSLETKSLMEELILDLTSKGNTILLSDCFNGANLHPSKVWAFVNDCLDFGFTEGIFDYIYTFSDGKVKVVCTNTETEEEFNDELFLDLNSMHDNFELFDLILSSAKSYQDILTPKAKEVVLKEVSRKKKPIGLILGLLVALILLVIILIVCFI